MSHVNYKLTVSLGEGPWPTIEISGGRATACANRDCSRNTFVKYSYNTRVEDSDVRTSRLRMKNRIGMGRDSRVVKKITYVTRKIQTPPFHGGGPSFINEQVTPKPRYGYNTPCTAHVCQAQHRHGSFKTEHITRTEHLWQGPHKRRPRYCGDHEKCKGTFSRTRSDERGEGKQASRNPHWSWPFSPVAKARPPMEDSGARWTHRRQHLHKSYGPSRLEHVSSLTVLKRPAGYT